MKSLTELPDVRSPSDLTSRQRLLASEIYGEDVVSPVGQIRLVRTDGDESPDGR